MLKPVAADYTRRTCRKCERRKTQNLLRTALGGPGLPIAARYTAARKENPFSRRRSPSRSAATTRLKKVNDLLASGASYAMVLRALGDDNAQLDKRDQVTVDSIRRHTSRHFPVQNVAKATYREILERRARANGVDFVEGVATALTPIAFFETVMVKSYETLVDSDTKVDVNTGIVAAGRLQSLIDSRDYSRDLLMMKVQLAAICDAVKSTVPHEMWGEIVEKLDELEEQHSEALDVGTDSFDDDDDDPYDPTEFIDDDDDDEF